MASRAFPIAVLALLSCAFAAHARADTGTPGQTRATIRGTGKDITIVYRGSAGAAPGPAAKAPPGEDALADAVRLAAGGADDASVIAYLFNHQADLPPVVESQAVRQLRRAGAGASVISYLSRLTALDIGETGEGSPPTPPMERGSTGFGMDLSGYGATAYPFYGYPTSVSGQFRRRGTFQPHRFPAHPGHLIFRGRFPVRGAMHGMPDLRP